MDINCFKLNNPTQYLRQPILFICYIHIQIYTLMPQRYQINSRIEMSLVQILNIRHSNCVIVQYDNFYTDNYCLLNMELRSLLTNNQ